MNTIAADLPAAPASAAAAVTERRAWQPKGLAVIFATEAWERFSYYGMRALLVLYLVNALGYKRQDALALYAIYTGLVYVTPLIGGWIADKWLGMRLAAVIGGTVMMLGHFAMAVPSMLHVALGLLIVGNGFFKPNTSSMVGELYEGPNDPRRDTGYSIFYMGINLGAFFSPLVCGALGQKVGWHWGFASAGVGMVIGLTTLLAFQPVLGRAGLRDDQAPVGLKQLPVIAAWTLACIGAVYLGLALGPIWSGLPVAAKVIAALVVIAAATQLPKLTGAGKKAAQPLTKAEWMRVIAICIVVLFSVVFWMGFEQAGGSMNLFADKQTRSEFFGMAVPSSFFQSLNPLFILVITLGMMAWSFISPARSALPETAKQGLGIVILGLGFAVMYKAQVQADATGPVSPMWLTVVYFLHTAGEMMLSPVGLSLTSRSAPAQIAALLMGVWMLSSAAGNYRAGMRETIMGGPGIPPYLFLTYLAIGAGVLLLLLTPMLRKMLDARDASTAA